MQIGHAQPSLLTHFNLSLFEHALYWLISLYGRAGGNAVQPVYEFENAVGFVCTKWDSQSITWRWTIVHQ
jgi:hypothetical protein